jgi:hypothetical protein
MSNAEHPGASSPANGESTLGDLFALSDEQILEIEPESQDTSLGQGAGPTGLSTKTATPPPDPAAQPVIPSEARNPSSLSTGEPKRDFSLPPSAPRNDSGNAAAPPKWLAEMMADPQAGGEARDFWSGIVKAREEARVAANRARQLEELDRAYFAGDARSPAEASTARERLAETLLREDPAAFREMVFAGLRALEKAGAIGAATALPPVIPSLPAQAGEVRTATSPRAFGAENPSSPAAHLQRDSSSQTPRNDAVGAESHLASYRTFEKAANEDLDRDVGGAISRTLEQALPNAAKGDGAALKERLAAAIHQDIEAALKSDRQLGEQVAQILAARRFDDATRAQVVRLIGERARQLVPAAARRVLNDWTQTALAAHRARARKTDAAAARPDVEGVGGPPASARARVPASREIDYRRMTDEQILDL